LSNQNRKHTDASIGTQALQRGYQRQLFLVNAYSGIDISDESLLANSGLLEDSLWPQLEEITFLSPIPRSLDVPIGDLVLRCRFL
jgi:hypothetical protein